MDELIKKSDNDPFLRRKLQNLMQNDLKSLNRMNTKNAVTENYSKNNVTVMGV